MTRAEQVRTLVAEMDAEGLEPDEIAARVGVPVSRVQRVLDALDGVPRPSLLLEAPEPAPERTRAPRGQGGKCGTYSGNAKHAAKGEKPCDRCAEARRVYQRDQAARKRAATFALVTV